jgi:NAD-dependent dihydropyrimidine dehydrogenase PreA subunit
MDRKGNLRMSGYGEWKGVPRERIPWHPTLDGTKCTGCGTCIEFCGHGVYSWSDAAGKPLVAEPHRCVVGCSSCRDRCGVEAISFPSLAVLRPFLKGNDE